MPADIGMRRDRAHHLAGIGIGVAAGEADQMDVGIVDLVDDAPRDMVRAFDEIGDRDDVADALAPVAAQIPSNIILPLRPRCGAMRRDIVALHIVDMHPAARNRVGVIDRSARHA
jgi:hypothetical protein